MASIASPALSQQLPNYTLVEVIYQGTRTTVYRALTKATQQPVVIKVLTQEHPSIAELLQFSNQYTVTKDLSIAGVIRPLSLEPCGNGYALVMEAFGGIDLGRYVQQNVLNLAEILGIGMQLADILHALHQHRVLHKDIKPANILIHSESQQIKLIDFGIASRLPKETQAIQSPQSLEGTLAYIAPEQTGRMNRAIDYRTDFYALGVTLYELLTGQLPFSNNDPLGLIHCHMAQLPTAVDQVNATVPAVVAAIVAKLMAKNAEDRYQSALGLKHDLERCLAELKTHGAVADFPLGQRDLSDRFLIPEKLYGREAEVETLLDAFERVSQGASELVLVAGFSGIGKTAVVNEVHKPIVRQRGYFIKGKFDQFNHNIPFSAFVQALRELMNQVFSESDEQLSIWRHRILEAVGENGAVLTEVIPELESVIGKQLPVLELSGEAAQNRFNQLFRNFVEVFTVPEHPLVLFLDDLQWADSASLNLIELLIANSRHLLLLGTYRDNEVSPIHPLSLVLQKLNKTKPNGVNTITLLPLEFADVNRLISATLGCATKAAHPLTELVQQKTQGNPFFITQFLRSLYNSKYLIFDYEQNYWNCDISQIKALSLTNDVVEFMAVQLQRLPVETQQVLKLASCLGNQFDLKTLAVVSEKPLDEVALNLWPSLQDELILPKSQKYKFYQSQESAIEPIVNPTYRFLHDRIQEAAYSLIPDSQRQATHLSIGKLLLSSLSDTELEDTIFDVANHWNIGSELITHPSERLRLCRLNLEAALKAKKAIAYDIAYQYAVTGINLLTSDDWANHYDLSSALHELAAELAYLKGDFDQSQHWGGILLQHTQTALDEVKIHEIDLLIHVARRQSSQAIALGQQILARLGVAIPTMPTSADIQQAWTEIADLMPTAQNTQSLLDLPVMTDAYALAALRILNSMAATVYLTRPKLLPLIVLAQVKLSLLKGNTPVSAGAYARYSFILCGKRNDILLGYEFGRLALSLSERFNDKEISTRVLLMVAALTLPWKVHLKESIPLLQQAYLHGLESGNLDGAALSHFYESQSAYLIGEPLNDLVEKVAIYSAQIRQAKQELHLNNNELLHQVILNLLGRTKSPCQLVGEAFDEEAMLPVYRSSSNMLGLYCLYLHKAILFYWFGQVNEAVAAIAIAADYLTAATAQATVPLFYFYDSLALLATYATAVSSEQVSILKRVEDNQQKLAHWVRYAPDNFQHKHHLVLAEKHRCLGHRSEAMDAYDRAISEAKKTGYIQEEALANELAAKFYLDWGKDKVAAAYMQEAYYCYGRWGARAKVADLETRYPELLASIRQSPTTLTDTLDTLLTIAAPTVSVHSGHRGNISTNSLNQTLDFASILKASQAISSTIQLDDLLHQFIQIMLTNSGSDRCALLLPDETGLWQVRAMATAQAIDLSTEPLDDNPHLPVNLVQYVKNTQEAVVIDDLETDLPVIDDYLRHHQPSSVLALPILNQGRCIGVLYLSNQLTSGAFTDERILVLNFLCTQASISLENARLYAQAQENQRRLTTLMSNLPGMAYLASNDEQWTMHFASEGCFELTGYTSDELTHNRITDFGSMIHPDDAEAVGLEVEAAIAAQRSFRVVYRIRTKQGQEKWLWEQGQAMLDDSGEPTLLEGLIIDISDRKQAEIARQKNEAHLRALVSALPDLIMRVSREGIYLEFSASPDFRVMGHLPDWVGTHVTTHMSPELAQQRLAAIQQALENRCVQTYEQMIDLEGAPQYEEVRVVPHAEDEVLLLVRDISDRKVAEEASQEFQRRLKFLIEQMPIGMVEWNLDFEIIGWNTAAAKIFGYSAAEMLGQQGMQFIPESVRPRVAEIRAELLEQRGGTFSLNENLRKDGTTIICEWINTVLRDADHNLMGVVSMVQDVSERESDKVAIAQKSQALKQTLDELQQTQLQMVQSEKMAVLGNLVAGVAHEINNPIGFLNGSIQNAEDYVQDLFGHLATYQELQPPSDQVQDSAEAIDLDFLREDLPKLLHSMKGATHRLKGISTSLRTFSRTDMEHQVRVNLREGLDSTLLILKYRLKANDQRPAIEVIQNHGELPEIECFPGQLNQVFMNILANAIDMFDEMAQQTTFEELRNTPQQITIQTAMSVDKHAVEIRIADNGAGMPDKVQSRIFDSSFTTKAVGKGTGLGLAIARQIVEETHDGLLEVESRVGQGTEFCIYLPAG